MNGPRVQADRLLARHLGAITRAVRIHDINNRAVSRLIAWCAADLTSLFHAGGDPRVELDPNGILIVNGTPSRLRRDMRVQLMPLSGLFRAVNSGGVRITGEVSDTQLLVLFRGLGLFGSSTSRSAAQAWLVEHGATSFELLAPRVLGSGIAGGAGAAVRIEAADTLQVYIRAVMAVGTALEEGTLARVPPGVFRAAQAIADLPEESRRMHASLAQVKEDLDYEVRHPVHVAIFATALAHRLGVHRTLRVELALAAMVFASLGDSPTPDQITRLMLDGLQGGRLSPARARRLLTLVDAAAGIDRTGPPGIHLESPPHLFARILAIADAFDRLTTRGDDRAGLMADEALAKMSEDGQVRLDAELVRIFSACIGRYPLGASLLLDSGEVAVVVHSPSDPLLADRPIVRVVRDARARHIDGGPLVDLSADDEPRRVRAVVDSGGLGVDTRRALYS